MTLVSHIFYPKDFYELIPPREGFVSGGVVMLHACVKCEQEHVYINLWKRVTMCVYMHSYCICVHFYICVNV